MTPDRSETSSRDVRYATESASSEQEQDVSQELNDLFGTDNISALNPVSARVEPQPGPDSVTVPAFSVKQKVGDPT